MENLLILILIDQKKKCCVKGYIAPSEEARSVGNIPYFFKIYFFKYPEFKALIAIN